MINYGKIQHGDDHGPRDQHGQGAQQLHHQLGDWVRY